ncbi:hypothetical protein N7532_007094 [Penicillium argentinense]|uniref:Potassium channel tetramerisation-type BTB domain-containing protein n=1 Tax=Penicillium argentinense TaxID=1131581 RepID=A0A9W9KBM2_9EURO|nr:uncharacterized protein N7532_007094 [Penicillium argentinense]KAJ5100093.1 hypothetical protein N7532_007094 [Penicillium argentinense]
MDASTPDSGCSLPPEKVFSIQIGSSLFRLSGASIASDGLSPPLPEQQQQRAVALTSSRILAPSYFSHFFEEQLRINDAANCRTLYIDRDPATFQEIARHLQGYHVRPRDGHQYVKLFADAQFYTCWSPLAPSPEDVMRVLTANTRILPVPRLMSQLFESEIFIQIGDRHFQIPRDIFSGAGNSPNFFTLGYGAFFASPTEVFPGLDRAGLLRPPAITPPSIPNKSADVFADLLHILYGYPLHIRNEDHRAELLRDCRWFNLRGVEQQLIPHKISKNPFNGRSEITIQLENLKPSGLQFFPDAGTSGTHGSIGYARPFADELAADLLLQTGDETTIINRKMLHVDFLRDTKARMNSLLQTISKKMNLQEPYLGGTPIKIKFTGDLDLTIDGQNDPMLARLFEGITNDKSNDDPPAKRPRTTGAGDGPWLVRLGIWRMRVQPNDKGGYESVLVPVKLDVYASPRALNRSREFL